MTSIKMAYGLTSKGTLEPLSDYAPHVYLQNDQGQFEFYDVTFLASGSDHEGFAGHFVDLNGNGVDDFIYSKVQNGADESNGTSGDKTEIIVQFLELN